MVKNPGASAVKRKLVIPIEVQKQILAAIKSINYGTVTLIIQDSNIIQIDKNEKIRLK